MKQPILSFQKMTLAGVDYYPKSLEPEKHPYPGKSFASSTLQRFQLMACLLLIPYRGGGKCALKITFYLLKMTLR
jgi:hypothetical protein